MTDNQSKEEKLAERKKELEDELDRYAQAGVSSPGVVKAARWVSRGMYLLMGAVVVMVLWTNRDAVPKKDFEAQKKRVTEYSEGMKKAQQQAIDAETAMNTAMQVAATKQAEANMHIDGHIAAEKAELATQNLVASYRGEVAYGIMWREHLAKADPTSFDGDPTENAFVLMEQASVLPAASRHEALRELHELGEEAVTAAAKQAFNGKDRQLAMVALNVFMRLNYTNTDILDLAKGAGPKMARYMAFVSSVVAPAAPNASNTALYHLADAWVGYVLLADDVNLSPLKDAFKSAPEEHRFELLALLAEVARTNESAFFRDIATQGRQGEKLIAIRWMGNRLDLASEELLKTLSGGKGDIAATAKEALSRIQDAKNGNE
ncbi:hypothetical protein OAU50_06660 [Planctomycetota bacterium]|nr:hypothetical protein [Planctomycetota bacterium]